VGGGVRGLRLLMTTGSAFTGFRRDALTTQHAAADRPLAGALDADWTFGAAPLPADEMVNALLESFADRPSNAVQQLLTEVGGAVLERWASLSTLGLRFESLPVTAVGDGAAYEVGGGPLGVTSVVLRRTS
jgi:urate oxidase